MANIKPISDLRNYNQVLKDCVKGQPVYLTKNGRGRFVIMDIEDYQRQQQEKLLLSKLEEAENSIAKGQPLIPIELAWKELGVQQSMNIQMTIKEIWIKNCQSIADWQKIDWDYNNLTHDRQQQKNYIQGGIGYCFACAVFGLAQRC